MAGNNKQLLFLLLLSFLLSLLLYKAFHAPTEDEEEEEEVSETMARRARELKEAKREKAKLLADFRKSRNPSDKTEMVVGSTLFKLIEPPLPFKKASSELEKLDERTVKMLQMFVPKTIDVRSPEEAASYPEEGDAWVGRKRKIEAKHKEGKDKNAEDNYGMMDPMMMMGGEGGEEKMCPAISTKTVLVPTPCSRYLKSVCALIKERTRDEM